MFDLDGTLVDSVPDIAAAADATLIDLGFAAAGELRVRDWVGNGARTLVARALAFAQAIEEYAVDAEQLTATHQLFLRHYQQANGDASCLYPHVEEALLAVQQKNIPMAIVTNKSIQFVPALLEKLSIDRYFDVLVGGECTDQKKPSPKPLVYACKLLNVEPDQCLMVGDSRHDIQAAKAIAMPVLAVRYGYNHGQAVDVSEPDWAVDDLSVCFS